MLAIARALMAQPKMLLLDEPSLGLAPLLAREIFAVVRRINAEGVAILLVEQNVRGALRLAARGYVLETGRVVASGARRLCGDRASSAYLGLDRPPVGNVMSTIRFADPRRSRGARGSLRRHLDEGADCLRRHLACRTSALHAHVPGYLERTGTGRARFMQRGRFTPLQRELIATAVSAVNSCHY